MDSVSVPGLLQTMKMIDATDHPLDHLTKICSTEKPCIKYLLMLKQAKQKPELSP